MIERRPKVLSNLKEIAKIKIRYDVTNKQDIEEQIALYEKYKKEILLNHFYITIFVTLQTCL